jgi:hypothetical protein
LARRLRHFVMAVTVAWCATSPGVDGAAIRHLVMAVTAMRAGCVRQIGLRHTDGWMEQARPLPRKFVVVLLDTMEPFAARCGVDRLRGSQAVTVVRNSSGQFVAGWQGGPGRKLGQRNKLSETFLQALGEDFALHGPAVIEKVRQTKPHHYLSVVASLCPRQLHVERTSPLGELSDDELTQIEEMLAATRAKLVQQLEQHNGAASPVADEPSEP